RTEPYGATLVSIGIAVFSAFVGRHILSGLSAKNRKCGYTAAIGSSVFFPPLSVQWLVFLYVYGAGQSLAGAAGHCFAYRKVGVPCIFLGVYSGIYVVYPVV